MTKYTTRYNQNSNRWEFGYFTKSSFIVLSSWPHMFSLEESNA